MTQFTHAAWSAARSKSGNNPQVRLLEALEGYLASIRGPEQRGPGFEEHRAYLQKHLRPALDFLASEQRDRDILAMMQDGLVSQTELDALIRRREDAAAPVQWLRLLLLKHASDFDGKSGAGTDTACRCIRGYLYELYDLFPFLDGAISALKLCAWDPAFPGTGDSLPGGGCRGSNPEGLPAACDGAALYYDREIVWQMHQHDPVLLRRTLLHLLLHCLLGHLWPAMEPAPAGSPVSEETLRSRARLRQAAADVHIEFLIERSCRSQSIRARLGSLPIPGRWTGLFDRMDGNIWTAGQILEQVPEKELLSLGEEMRRDSHWFWPAQTGAGEERLRRRWEFLAREAAFGEWQEQQREHACGTPARLEGAPREPGASAGQGSSRNGASGFGIGANAGSDALPAGMIAMGIYDYRSFLHRFCVFREELEQDPGSFDLIYYTFGMEHYGNLPLLEPLETREASRMEELVIAIDTSGSCKEPTVRRFLEETRSILEEKESFFERMNVWILQCDCLIQSAVNIRSRSDWDAYLRELQIIGRSGTDFRPVFRYVEKLHQEGKLKDLKALIYFTDGDGVYPHEAPPYETAFVFVEEPDSRLHSPAWARQLVAARNES